MAYISYYKLWKPKFYGIVSKRGKVQDATVNQIKLKVNETYRKDEKNYQILNLVMMKMF